MRIVYECPACGKTGNHPKFSKDGKKVCCEHCDVWTALDDIGTKVMEITK